MEVLLPSSTLSINHQLSPAISFIKWRSWKKPSGLAIPDSSRLALRRSFLLYSFPPICSKRSRISAHFGCRPNSRQNYLRKKLIHKKQQFQEVSLTQNPPRDLNKVDLYESDFGNSVSENLGGMSLGNNFIDSVSTQISDTAVCEKHVDESMNWNKLQSWAAQYKKDSEFWGIGTAPIFIICQNSEGKVERVVVNEDEILRRSCVDPRLDNEIGKTDEVNFKISFAKDLARNMENGSSVVPKNSSVVKVLLSNGESNLAETIKVVALKPGFFLRMSGVGVLALCGVYVIWTIRRLLPIKEDGKTYTRLEKEMLRRKIKARAHKQEMVKDSVEVVQDPTEPRGLSFTRPHIDKEALMNSIIEAKTSYSKLEMVEKSTYQNNEFEDKIEEIKAMARHAREIERGCTPPDVGEVVENLSSRGAIQENKLLMQNDVYDNCLDATSKPMSDIGKPLDEASDTKNEVFYSGISGVVMPNGAESSMPEARNLKMVQKSAGLNEAHLHSNVPCCQLGPNENSSGKKFQIITSAKEAKEYLLWKNHKLENQNCTVRTDEQADTAIAMVSTNVAFGNTGNMLNLPDEVYDTSPSGGMNEFSHLYEDDGAITEATEEDVANLNNLEKSKMPTGCEVSVNNNGAGISVLETLGEMEDDIKTSQNSSFINEMSPSPVGVVAYTSATVDQEDSILRDVPSQLNKQNPEDIEKNETFVAHQLSGTTSINAERDTMAGLSQSVDRENWMEKNFHEFEPIVEKIGVGFRENYLVAREKANQELDSKTDLIQLKFDGLENELEWMKDERLMEIVLKVRDNELSGRDPFHLMEEEDKSIFFRGLEQKVEKVNEKLLSLHQYFHSNIENLDYGADGISIYDPPEKIIPRWKVPPVEKNPEFLEDFLEQRKALATKNLKNSFFSNKAGKSAIDNSEGPSFQNTLLVVREGSDTSTELKKDTLASSKTIIQGSDGSIKKGKRYGKEFWQHTKKWSQGFLESYSSETDPEVKAVMKDIGKDLDRWITEKEIQEAAELMDKLPEKGQKFIKQKLDKVKREMELFGPQAVVSKYREYAVEKEEDCLWWLDLPFVLCIELYTVENGEQRVGLYSLEMAADLELNPKQYHVIAFEDACDCKNLCYIIQAQMEVLGNGIAFVVARPPKDAFREAKANGSSITVIRKGQLRLNIDQKLEEVEESITEIGSKIYHDKIMKERGVDINALMKGVFGISKPAKRKRSKQN